MKNFFQISLTVYFITLFVFSFWSALTQQANQDWVGSLVFLPHGCKVIFICFFGLKAVPALLLAEFTGQLLELPNTDMTYLYIGTITSLASVVLAAEIIKWTQIANFKPADFFLDINYSNFKFIVFVIILSALLNSISSNLVLSQLNQVAINVEVIVRFFIGDIVGSTLFILFALIALKLLVAQKNRT